MATTTIQIIEIEEQHLCLAQKQVTTPWFNATLSGLGKNRKEALEDLDSQLDDLLALTAVVAKEVPGTIKTLPG